MARLLGKALQLDLALGQAFRRDGQPGADVHALPALCLCLGQSSGKGLIRHPHAGLQRDAGTGLPFPLHLVMDAATALPCQRSRGGRVELTGGKIGVGGDQRLGKAVKVVLLPFHKPPVHPALMHQLAELLRREIPHKALHPGHGLCLVPAVFLRQTAHDLLLHQQGIPQRVHAVGHRVGGLLVLRHFQPLAAGAVLGLRPVFGQIFIDPCHGFFVIARGLQPLHIIG